MPIAAMLESVPSPAADSAIYRAPLEFADQRAAWRARPAVKCPDEDVPSAECACNYPYSRPTVCCIER